MSTEANKTFIQQYLDALNRDKSPATLDTYMTDESLKQHIAMYDAVLPGYWIEVEDIMAEGDKVTIRGLVHGVHNGPLMDIAPTGNQVTVPAFVTYRIANGKIVEHWQLADMLSLLQQVGAMPAPAGH